MNTHTMKIQLKQKISIDKCSSLQLHLQVHKLSTNNKKTTYYSRKSI